MSPTKKTEPKTNLQSISESYRSRVEQEENLDPETVQAQNHSEHAGGDPDRGDSGPVNPDTAPATVDDPELAATRVVDEHQDVEGDDS